jgi:mono/diheme cytochrome c family protein
MNIDNIGISVRKSLAGLLSLLLFFMLAGCHTDMWVQKKVDHPFARSDFFADQSSARMPVPHTVAMGEAPYNDPYDTGMMANATGGSVSETGLSKGRFVNAFPFKVTKKDLLRGQSQFDIYCSPCHGVLGDGNGMVAIRGFVHQKPANFHTKRLMDAPVGHFFDVITNGYGIMYSYASSIPNPRDRWDIAAYIRVLQFSQHAPISAVPKSRMKELMNSGNDASNPVVSGEPSDASVGAQ